MAKKLSLLTISLIILSCTQVLSWDLPGSYQYLSAAAVKQKLTEQAPLSLLDIQVEAEFKQHHIGGAIATYSYPVKSATDLAKLAPIVKQLKARSEPVVVICPRGGGGAKRAYDYLQEQGIAAERLFILTDGQQGWPYPELLTKG